MTDVPSISLPRSPQLTQDQKFLKITKEEKIAVRVITDAASEVKSGKKAKEVILTTADNQQVAVKVKDLAKTLYVSESHIERAHKSGNLDSLVASLSTAMEGYKEQFSRFEKDRKLVIAETGAKSPITASQLMKTTSKAFSSMYTGETAIIDLGLFQGKVVVTRTEEGPIEILKNVKRLGKGSFGKADEVVNVMDNTISAVKLARQKPYGDRSWRNYAIREVQNEMNLLTLLHDHGTPGKKLGIQHKPRTVFCILHSKKTDKIKEIGHIGTVYTRGSASSLGEHPEFQGAQALNVLGQLFSALALHQELDIVHCDIKPANIFWNENADPENRFEVDISDYGGAKRLTDAKDPTEFGRGTRTDSYTCSEDDRAIESLDSEHGSKRIDDKAFKDGVRSILYAGDVYSAALSYVEMLTGEWDPLGLSQKELRQMCASKGISGDIADLLHSCLSEDYTKRPSPKVVLDAIQKAGKGG